MSHVSADYHWAKMTSRVFVLLTVKSLESLETQNSRLAHYLLLWVFASLSLANGLCCLTQ